MAGKRCQERGWADRPLWLDVANGLRPAERPAERLSLGEWQHGWQYYASDALERDEWQALMRELALPSVRSNAASSSKARLNSCMGPFASVWLTVCPTSEALRLSSAEVMCAIRRRLGIAVAFEGEDVHGHAVFGDNTGGRLNISLDTHFFLMRGGRSSSRLAVESPTETLKGCSVKPTSPSTQKISDVWT